MMTISRTTTERNQQAGQEITQGRKTWNQQQKPNMEKSSQFMSVMSINVNGLNSPVKRSRWTEWIKKPDPTIFCIQETHLIQKETHRLIDKGCKTIFHATGTEKTAGLAIWFADKVDIKPKIIKRDTEGHYVFVSEKLQEEVLPILNIYAPNTGAPNCIRQTQMDGKNQIHKTTIVIGDLNTPLSQRVRSTR